MALAVRVLAAHLAARHAVDDEEALHLERQERVDLARHQLAAQVLDRGESLDEDAAHAALPGARGRRCGSPARPRPGPASQ